MTEKGALSMFNFRFMFLNEVWENFQMHRIEQQLYLRYSQSEPSRSARYPNNELIQEI